MAENFVKDSKCVEGLDKKDGNNKCFECGSHRTCSVSVTYAVYLCRYCAVLHEHLGGSMTVVKPLNVAHWDRDTMHRMITGGNKAAQQFFINHPDFHPLMPLKDKYSSKAAQDYREKLDMLCGATSQETCEDNFLSDFSITASWDRPFDANKRSQSSYELPASPDWSFQAEYGSFNYRSFDDSVNLPSSARVHAAVDNTLDRLSSVNQRSGWEKLEGDNREARRGSQSADGYQVDNTTDEHSAMRPSASEPCPQWNEQQNELAGASNSVAARNFNTEDLSQAGVTPSEPRSGLQGDDAWLNN